MVQPARASAPWIFWPIAALWDLVAFVLRLTGRVAGAAVSLALIATSILLGLTIIGLPIAIPLFFVGCLLLVRSIF
jgi:hypothetical protein